MNGLAPNTERRLGAELSWHMPGKVMCLRIRGDYSVEDSLQVAAAITQELDGSPTNLILLIDALAMNRPQNFHQLRLTQTYMDHQKLKHIYVLADDRVVKLAMMIIFNVCRAGFRVLNDVKLLDDIVRRQSSSFN